MNEATSPEYKIGPNPAAPIRLFIVQTYDQPIARAGLRLLLDHGPGVTVVGDSSGYDDAMKMAAELQPGIILFDMISCDETEFKLLADLVGVVPSARIIAFMGPREPELQRRAISLGVIGIVFKEQSSAILRNAIARVHSGEVWLERNMTAVALKSMTQGQGAGLTRPQERIASLTDREREVVALVGQGLKNTGIAERLFLSEAAVRHRLSSIFEKLGVNDRLELLIFAYKYGLAELPR